MFIQSIIDALVQVVIFTIIPFLYWAIAFRKRESFAQWIGLKKVVFNNKTKALIFSVLSFVILLLSGIILLSVIDDKTMIANAQFSSMGMQSILLILIYAIVQTGLSEELLFRGFLLKVFSGWWGFGVGNFIQALLFGLLHGAILFTSLNTFLVISIIVFSALAGWMMGYVNEKLGNGSILPSWLIHSLMNISSSLLLAFNFL
ncbi:MAG: lysostaphin resistance A-like protein [Bavariicoccus seileri]|uniref:CPBP family intramembrane glutamic endopeptidase n=1 Tax=Lactobacillales TaxID=186826 RepID=UPI001867AA06|nr:CPBP family intramembrane glutamic endopeptidase [Marinilactibacillus psychrotolerans]MDN6572418.1 CPBP family intramembrane metalloprotease [Staphylococcus equorum]